MMDIAISFPVVEKAMRTVVCVGGGRIGSRAAREARAAGARVLVVDEDRHCLASRSVDGVVEAADCVLDAEGGRALLMVGDGTSVLLDIMRRWVPDLVVPGARGHMAGNLAVEHCRSRGPGLAPAPDLVEALVGALPQASIAFRDHAQAVVATSHMSEGGSCIEDCQQPGICPVTGAPVPAPMHDVIQRALEGVVDRPVVLRAYPIVAMGGIHGPDLAAMLSALDGLEEGRAVGIATSCRCHGMINLLRAR